METKDIIALVLHKQKQRFNEQLKTLYSVSKLFASYYLVYTALSK